MAEIVTRRSIEISGANSRIVTQDVSVDPATHSVTVRIKRPTTAEPLAWAANSSIRIHLVVTIGGQEYRCTGQASGGVRLAVDGSEIPEYVLRYRPPFLIDGRTLAQRDGTTMSARVEIERIRGNVTTELLTAETR